MAIENALERRLRPRIQNNVIINLAEVCYEIRLCKETELLQEFASEVKRYSLGEKVAGMEQLKFSLTLALITKGYFGYYKDIIETIRKCENQDLLNDLKAEAERFGYYKEIEEIKSIIDLKLQELEQAKTSNRNVLEVLKKQNPNLNGLSVVETKKEQNDSMVNIDYIKLIDEKGEIQMLECRDANTLNEFIKDNLELAISGGAKEIYDYFKTYKHSSLRFESFSEHTTENIKTELESMKINDPRINNENDFIEEKRLTQEFAQWQQITSSPRISINSYGERIYTVGDIVIKFRDESGKRTMEIISGNQFVKDEVGIASEEAVVETPDTITSEQRGTEIPNADPALISETTFNQRLEALYSGNELSDAEKREMEFFVQTSIAQIGSESASYDLQNSIDLYMEYLKGKEEGIGLASSEALVVERYTGAIKQTAEEKAQTEEAGVKNGEVKALRFILPDNTKGIIVTVFIIEATIILGVILSALALANR